MLFTNFFSSIEFSLRILMKPNDVSFELLQNRINHTVKMYGLEFYNSVKKLEQNKFSKHYWTSFFLGYISKFPEWKLELFRLVDVIPSLKSKTEISKHVELYLVGSECKKPLPWQIGFGLFSLFGLQNLLSTILLFFIKNLAYSFIAGTDILSAEKKLQSVRKKGRRFTLDILGEAALSERESLSFQKVYLDILDRYPLQDTLGIPVTNLSVKCSSLCPIIDPLYFENSVSAILEKLKPILQKALQRSVFINLDMEQADYKEIVIEVSKRILLSPDYISYPHFGIVIQAYLKDSLRDLESLYEIAIKREAPFTIRLVKGAYWELELMNARKSHWEEPVYLQKWETDQNYERCLTFLLGSFPKIRTAIASHNLRSLSYGICLARELNIPPKDFEIQMLFGMADSYKEILIKQNLTVTEYIPLGDILPGMAYLVRRLIENTTNEGFLKNLYTGNINPNQFLEIPKDQQSNV
jgi:proline dehydrogenase